MKLTELKRGEVGIIRKIESAGELKKRLIDLGINQGQLIKFERNAPLGDPQEYRINGNSIAIRKEDAENITVDKEISI